MNSVASRATVIQVSPLLIRIDGSTVAAPAFKLPSYTTTAVGQRVYYITTEDNKLLVLGVF